MTTLKGKRKNTRTNNLKQEEKIILRFLLFNRRLLALNAVTAVNFVSSQMVQHFALLLILCIAGGSLETTTTPQQQNTAKLKDLCEVRNGWVKRTTP